MGGVVVGGVVVGTEGLPGIPGFVGCGTGLPGWLVVPLCGSLGLVAGSGVTGGVVAGVVVCPFLALLLGALGLRRCSGVVIFLSSVVLRVRSVVVRALSVLFFTVSVCAEAIPKASTAVRV